VTMETLLQNRWVLGTSIVGAGHWTLGVGRWMPLCFSISNCLGKVAISNLLTVGSCRNLNKWFLTCSSSLLPFKSIIGCMWLEKIVTHSCYILGFSFLVL